MNGIPALAVKCDRYDECRDRHEALERRVASVETRQQSQGESIAALRAQVASAAAFGSLVGGGVVALVVKMIAH
jgi:uncharacterized coiled-coil protein SlyX